MSRRTERVSEAIRQVVSHAILFDLKDPRVTGVTVTLVETSGDLRQAKIYVSIMGDDKSQRLVLHGLESSRGFLQHKVAERLDLRYTPHLAFVIDEGVKRSLEMSKLLSDLAPKTTADAPTEDDESAPAEESEKLAGAETEASAPADSEELDQEG